MYTFTIKLEGHDEVQKSVEDLLKNIEPELENGLDKAAEFAEIRIKEAAPVGVTGHLRESVTTIVSRLRREIGPTAEYADAVERGRSAGNPPPQADVRGAGIARWAAFVGKTAKGESFAIAKSIGTKGTEATWFVKNRVPEIENRFWSFMEEAADKIAGFIVS